jgi:hypothetical protein
MKHFGQLEATVRPARHRFADIALIYMTEGKALPESVEDGWLQFERVLEWAWYELRTGLWGAL